MLFLIAEIIERKQVAQLEFYDYITRITIGSIAAELAATPDKPRRKLTVILSNGKLSIFPKSRKRPLIPKT